MPGASSFRGYCHDYIGAGIRAGLKLKDVRKGRFIITHCNVGPGYSAYIPVLLPDGPVRSKIVELEYAGYVMDWETYPTDARKTRLAKFRRYIDNPSPEYLEKLNLADSIVTHHANRLGGIES